MLGLACMKKGKQRKKQTCCITVYNIVCTLAKVMAYATSWWWNQPIQPWSCGPVMHVPIRYILFLEKKGGKIGIIPVRTGKEMMSR